MKFTSKAQSDPELYKKLMVAESDPTVPKEIKEKAAKFWKDWKDDKIKMLQTVVDLEKAAMNKGFSLAISFVSGHCQLCEKCSTENRICVNQTLHAYQKTQLVSTLKRPLLMQE